MSNYTKPELREKIKSRILASSKGGNPGQWSARKAQLVANEYKKAGGGYKDKASKKQKSLKKWTKQEWTTSDGKPSRRLTKSGKEVVKKYLPKKAWDNLDKEEVKKLDRSKRKAEKKGEQFSSSPKKLRSKISKYWKK